MDASLQTILDSPEFSSFLPAAKAFCNFIETSEKTGKPFVYECQDHLLALYTPARKLTDAGVADSNDGPDLPDEEVKKILKLVGQRLPFQYYWIALNPIIETEEDYDEGVGDVTDDITEIYRELKPALLLIESDFDNDKINAVWQLKLTFDTHWNDHCINALHAIHHYLEKHKYDE